MRRVLAAVAAAVLVVACVKTEPQNEIVGNGAWGCRDRDATVDMLFLGASASFQSNLAHSLANGTCVYFQTGEKIVILHKDSFGLTQVRRTEPPQMPFWTQTQNVK